MTEAGKRAAYGHTVSMTSSVAVFDALCRQLKTIVVADTEELIDVLVALRLASPLPRGTGVAVLGTGGGPSVLASDEIEKAGLHLPCISPEVQSELRKFLPIADAIFSSPVDAMALLSPEAIFATMSVLGKLPDIHMFIYHLGFHPVSRWGDSQLRSATFLQPVIDVLTEVQKMTGKPALLALRPAPDLDGMKDFLAAQEAFVGAGFPVFHSLSQMGRAMARVVAWNEEQHR